jgi:hypothetical protein
MFYVAYFLQYQVIKLFCNSLIFCILRGGDFCEKYTEKLFFFSRKFLTFATLCVSMVGYSDILSQFQGSN